MNVYGDESCGGADFCDEISGDQDTTFNRIYLGRPASRKILTTDQFILFADLSPLTLGHLLLLPKKHYLSFAQVAQAIPHQLSQILASTRSQYAATFGESVILEHGSTVRDDRSACITHAHWHIVPLSGDQVDHRMRQDGLRRDRVPDLTALGTTPWISSPYYLTYYGDDFGLYRPRSGIPRQYIRSVIGRSLGMSDPEWDYALFVRQDLLRETMTRTATWHTPDDHGLQSQVEL